MSSRTTPLLTGSLLTGILMLAAAPALAQQPQVQADVSADVQATAPAASASANADGPALTALIRTEVPDPQLADFGRAIERVVRAQATDLEVVEFSGTPALALNDIQLMVGCLSESQECFDQFAEQLQVEALLLPTIERADDEYMITVTYYDRRTRALRSEARRSAGGDVESSLIAAIDMLLRELFDLPPAPEGTYDFGPQGNGTVDEGGVSGLGIALTAVGVATLAAAIGVGVAASNANDDYLALPTPVTRAEVDALADVRASAETKGTAATALYIAGGAVAALGVVLLIVLSGGGDDDEDEEEEAAPEPEVAFAPMVGRGMIGLSIGGTL